MTRFGTFLLLGAVALVSSATSASAQCVSLTTAGSAYTQNFDTLANSGTSSTVPAGWAFSETGTNANTTYSAGTGSSNTGDTYSFGASASSERALGGLLSGSVTPTIGGCFTNNTGSTLSSLDIAYTGEQWRLGATGRADRIDFQYSLDATSLTTGAWTDVDGLDFNSPVTNGTVGLLDGNAAANRTAVSSSIGSLSIANGATFWIRWNDFNATSSDDGLAVDDFSLTPQAPPPPPPPTTLFEFGSATTSAGEAAGSQNVSVTISEAPANNVGVSYSFTDGTAVGGASCTTGIDYINTGGTLSWTTGDATSKAISVTLCDDTLYEGDEGFTINLLNPTGGAGLGAQTSNAFTITDNDTQPSIQFVTDTYYTLENVSNSSITVTRTGATGNAVSVNYATSDGTATGGATCAAGVDYIITSGTLNFAAGETSKVFLIPHCDDALAEPDETINLALSSPGGGAVIGGQSTAVARIQDNDVDTTPPVITYTPLSNIPTPADRTLTVTVTDDVAVSSVRLNWTNNDSPTGASTSCTLVSGSTYNCPMWASDGTPPMSNPGVVSYYVSATDTSNNPSSNPTSRNLFTIGTGGTVDVMTNNTFENAVLGDGFTLNGNATVNGNLTLNGILNTGANKITLGCDATVTGAGELSYIVGSLEREFCTTGSYDFPVGASIAVVRAPEGSASANYSPMTANVTSVVPGSSLTVSVNDDFLADTDNTQSLSRYWDITENGDVTADLTFQYRPEDVNGTPANYLVLKRESSSTAWYPPGSINTGAFTFTANNVADYSSWSAGLIAPTAANASVEGRVRTAGGLGIRNATVVISGGGLDVPRTVQTGSFGNFRFDDLPVGETYIISVVSPRYVFANPTQLVTLDDNVIGLEFESIQ